MRYTGHLDLILTWERTFRRSGLPLSYSEGFNPRPVINLASPLPLGFTSSSEIGDFWLSEVVPPDVFQSSLSSALPPGLSINHIEELEEVHGKKLPGLVISATYHVDLDIIDPDLSEKIKDLLGKSEFLKTNKRGKEYDLRPLILDLKLIEHSSQKQTMEISLVTQPDKTGRPDEVLAALVIPNDQAHIHRTAIGIKNGDKS